jgi:hypothetical protein
MGVPDNPQAPVGAETPGYLTLGSRLLQNPIWHRFVRACFVFGAAAVGWRLDGWGLGLMAGLLVLLVEAARDWMAPHHVEGRVMAAYLIAGAGVWFIPLLAPVAVMLAYSGYRRALANPSLGGRPEAMAAMVKGTAVTGVFFGLSLILSALELVLPLILHYGPPTFGAGSVFAILSGALFFLSLELTRRCRREGSTNAPSRAKPGQAVSGRLIAGSGAKMCEALRVSDLTALGLKPDLVEPIVSTFEKESAYCTFTKASGAQGGIEFDIFFPAGNPKQVEETVISEEPLLESQSPAGLPNADNSLFGIVGPATCIVVRKSQLVFTITVPTTLRARDQLISLSRLVLQRVDA